MGRPNDGGYVIPEKYFHFVMGYCLTVSIKIGLLKKIFGKKTNTIIHCYDHSVSFLTLIFFTISLFSFNSATYSVRQKKV